MGSATQVLKQIVPKRFQDIPGPKSFPVIGTLHNYFPVIGEFNLQRLHHSGMLKYRRYGKLIKEEIIPGVNLLFLYDPTDIESMFRLEGRYPSRRSHTALEKFRMDTPDLHKSGGLLPTNGIEWANMRGQYQQSLSRESVQGFITQTDEIVFEFLQRVNDPLEQPLLTKDFLPYLMSVYAEILGSNLFSIRFGALTSVGKPESLGEKLIKAGETVNSLTLRTDNGPRLWQWFDTPLYKSLKTNMGYLEK
ncbi:unnamed protein product [Allacma fusca]|uniref:Cytochrome P450 n=1 Tax=Allacma fusca TaxID=39272 RepID=A0A8J2KAJ3_9HEXA|nr:unnamed protein product [Allacma fusca]